MHPLPTFFAHHCIRFAGNLSRDEIADDDDYALGRALINAFKGKASGI